MAEEKDERYARNILIAAAVGGFLLPLAGVIGSIIFYVRKQEREAWIVLGCSIVGIVSYTVLISAGGGP